MEKLRLSCSPLVAVNILKQNIERRTFFLSSDTTLVVFWHAVRARDIRFPVLRLAVVSIRYANIDLDEEMFRNADDHSGKLLKSSPT